MRFARVRFNLWQLTVVVAVVALFCSVERPNSWYRPPRAAIPVIAALYLAWAAVDGVRAVGTSRQRVLWFGLPLTAVLATVAFELNRRQDAYGVMAAEHAWDAFLCERSAQGACGIIMAHERPRCSYHKIPEAKTPAGRATMRRLARYHDRMKLKYERAWLYPWLAVVPSTPES